MIIGEGSIEPDPGSGHGSGPGNGSGSERLLMRAV